MLDLLLGQYVLLFSSRLILHYPLTACYHYAMRILTICLLFILLPACQAGGPAVMLKGQRFVVEVADDDASRMQGLMFRQEMARDAGMLFLFPDEQRRSFWMKNTKIPLDIFYFDQHRRLVNVVENARPCRVTRCPGYASTGPAMYVLELNAGQARALNAEPGDELTFIDVQPLATAAH